MRVLTLIIMLTVATYGTLYAQNYHHAADSIAIERILHKENISIIDIAESFIGYPYVAGTLDKMQQEHLTINIREFDCTTFVETVTALFLTAQETGGDFNEFCKKLELIRYRNGKCNDYASRLHYTSQWIADSAKRNIIEEIITPSHTATQNLWLNFMSTHPKSYPQLKEQPCLVNKIEECEAPFRGIEIRYIPKNLLNAPKAKLRIADGDILALVTTIEGLDVSHVGFAKWIDDKLHLLHASSGKGNVVLDKQTLYDYLSNKKNNPGIRVFRIQR